MLADVFRDCLDRLDVATARRVWAQRCPHLPQPANATEMLTVLHAARTAAKSSPFAQRAYSHKWLVERGLPSQLPDAMRPKAKRLYPHEVGSVGVAVASRWPEVATAIRGVMENVVLDFYAEGDADDTERMRKEMQAALMKERKALMLPSLAS